VGEVEDLGAALPERVEGDRHGSSITRSHVSCEQLPVGPTVRTDSNTHGHRLGTDWAQ
jgi:hypothetical protein